MTEIARTSIETLKLGTIAFRDTDSCGILGVLRSLSQIKSDFVVLNKLINTTIQAKLGNTYNFDFVPEVETY